MIQRSAYLPVCLIVAAVLAAIPAPLPIAPARASVRIYSDTGGQVGGYVARYWTMRQSGQQVIVDGMCYSACTMVLGYIPRERLCVTPNAVFGFHAAWRVDGAGQRHLVARATQALMQIYPPDIRAWIERHGGLTTKLLFLRGHELAGIVAPCGSTERSARRPGALPAGPQAVRPDQPPASADAQE